MVIDVVGSESQNRESVSHSRVLLASVRLKCLAVLVILPPVDFHEEFAHLEIKAVTRNENIVLRIDSFCSELPTQRTLRWAIGADRGVPNRVFQRLRNAPHTSAISFQAAGAMLSFVVFFQQGRERTRNLARSPQRLHHR